MLVLSSFACFRIPPPRCRSAMSSRRRRPTFVPTCLSATPRSAWPSRRTTDRRTSECPTLPCSWLRWSMNAPPRWENPATACWTLGAYRYAVLSIHPCLACDPRAILHSSSPLAQLCVHLSHLALPVSSSAAARVAPPLSSRVTAPTCSDSTCRRASFGSRSNSRTAAQCTFSVCLFTRRRTPSVLHSSLSSHLGLYSLCRALK